MSFNMIGLSKKNIAVVEDDNTSEELCTLHLHQPSKSVVLYDFNNVLAF